MAEPLAALPPTTAIADVLRMRGREGWLSPPLVSFGDAREPVGGRAVTVQVTAGPAATGTGLEPIYDLLSEDLTGKVVVLAGVEEAAGAIWGEIFVLAAKSAGASGVVVAGPVRDLEALAASGLPVWGLASRTVGIGRTVHVSAVEVPVRIAGVDIEPGDVVILDADGVVVVDAADRAGILPDASAYARAEAEVVALLADRPLRVAYEAKRAVVARLSAASPSTRDPLDPA